MRTRKTTEVTCKNCLTAYQKRVDTMKNWSGLCRVCLNKSSERRELSRITALSTRQKYGPITGQISQPGESNPAWKGAKVGYQQLHNWVRKELVRPTSCEHCGKQGVRFEWANRSHHYKRNLEDWINLCRQCHAEYDKQYRYLTKKENSYVV